MNSGERSRQKTARLFRRVIKRCLKVHEKMTVSQWAEKNRVLDDSANLSGKWSNKITPYLVEIMDCLNDPYIRKIFFCKPTQVGGTEAMINMLCYIIDQSAAPTMIVYPSDDLAKDTSTDRLKPAFRLIPNLKKLFHENASKALNLKFKTMNIYLRGAGSPSKLASKPIKYLFFDEIDKMGGSSSKEANPYNLALERTKTYRPLEKVFATSTPTLKTNYIWKLTQEADEVRHYFVKCPHCGEEIELLFKSIVYDKDEEQKMSNHERAMTANYVCQVCGCIITDADKPKMLREGRWKAVEKRGKGKPKSVGFWISALYSIFLNWSDIVEEFLNSKDDPERLQNFVNSWLAEAWEDTRMRTTEDTVMERQTELEEFILPEWAKLLTAGVDVQEKSMYYVIRAFGEYTTSQLITHGQVASFMEIEDIMNREYETEIGRKMVVDRCLIDSGYQADTIYDFCLDNSDWAFPVKGASNPMLDRYKISKLEKEGKAYGMQLFIVDGGKYKDSISARMRRENGIGSWMVFKDIDQEYAKQVTAEHKVMVKLNNGKKVQRWVMKNSHGDNHYLDCEVYAMASAESLGVRSLHLDKIENIPDRQQEDAEREAGEWIPKVENWLGNSWRG